MEEWERQTPACASFSFFAKELHGVIGHGSSREAVAGELLRMHQGTRSVMDFAVDFRIVAKRSRWPPEPLADVFSSSRVPQTSFP